MPKFCKKCGSPLEEGERFCPQCGAPVQAGKTAEDGKPGVDWKQLVPKVSIGKPQVHVNKKALIALAVVVVIILIASLF